MRMIQDETDFLAGGDESPRYQGKAARKMKNVWGLLKWPVYAAFGFGGGYILYRSYGLYTVAFQKWGLSAIGHSCQSFDWLPLLGGLVSGGCLNVAKLIIGGIAIVSLLALSILMSIPVLLYFSPSSIEGMVHQVRRNERQHAPLQGEASDTGEVKYLIRRHRSINRNTLRTLLALAVAASCLEMGIVWVARGGRADVLTVMIDSFGLEMLLAGFFIFKNAFRATPPKKVMDVD